MKVLNKRLSILLCLVLLTGRCAPAALAAEENTVIRIYTVNDFIQFAKQCSLDSWSQDKTVLLERNIDLSLTQFQPIPTFGGTFDGQGHTITLKKKAKITRAVASPAMFDEEGEGVMNYGLMFTRVEDAIIKNIRIVYTERPSSFRVVNNIEGTHAGGGIGIVCGGADRSVFEDISVSLVGILPLLINSTKLSASSFSKLPSIITSLAKP